MSADRPASAALARGGAEVSRGARVLVLGSDTRAFLSVIRSLGRRGLHVHVAWCPPGVPALRSRYVRRVHRLPMPSADVGSWLPALRELLARERFDLVVPCDDQVQIPLQAQRRQLEPWARIYLLDDAAFRVVSDKVETVRLAERLGVAVPRGVLVSREEEIATALAAFPYPVVVKPRSSFSESDLANRNWVTRAHTPEALRRRLGTLLPRGPVLVQETVRGVGTGVELLAWRGQPLVWFQHERVHEPLEGGGSTYRRSVPLHPELQEASARLIEALAYTGVAMVEFKLDHSTGRWALMEINGRFWGSLPLAVAAGADFPAHLYDMLVHARREFPSGYRVPVYCRNLRSDLRWNWINLRADRSDPALHARPLRSVAGEVAHWIRGRERFDTLTLDDPRPGLVELAELLRDGGRAAAAAAGRGLRALPWRRAARRRRARARAQGAKRIVFVCFGNICRSPFAAERARALLPPEVVVESAGTHETPGRPSPAEAVRAAREFGVELASHRSLVASAEQLARADLVVVFDEKNRRDVAARFPDADRRVVALSLFSDTLGDAIADPYGGDDDRFVVTYRQIEQALHGLRAAVAGDAGVER